MSRTLAKRLSNNCQYLSTITLCPHIPSHMHSIGSMAWRGRGHFALAFCRTRSSDFVPGSRI
eukprot:5928265-Amphidinium_carterae.1